MDGVQESFVEIVVPLKGALYLAKNVTLGGVDDTLNVLEDNPCGPKYVHDPDELLEQPVNFVCYITCPEVRPREPLAGWTSEYDQAIRRSLPGL